jgi:hypothetical protein
MITEPIESLLNKILNQYNRRPEGWSVMADRKGNVLVIGPKVGYRLKLVPINPHEYTGVGIRVDELEEVRNFTDGTPSYGFRPLSTQATEELFNTISKRAVDNNLINELLEKKTVPTHILDKRRPRSILTGPIITHPNLCEISKSQRELETKLNIEADKLFRKRYPRRALYYG